MTTLPPGPPDPLLSQRALLVLLTAAFLGTVIGALTFLGGGSAATAVVAGLVTAGASTLGLHTLIGR
ncbi:hypothetical protein [Streptomyces anthocyanicus]|uniref:hypothetical protein n=1 Tax=Streptomyces anthocyanicus TaxID=68174 RepID=UPI0037F97A36